MSEECCPSSTPEVGSSVLQKLSISGSLDLDVGVASCSYNITQALPKEFLALIGEVQLAVSINTGELSFANSCDKPEKCFTVQGITIKATGSLTASAADGYVSCCASVDGSATGSVKLCFDDGFTVSEVTAEPAANAHAYVKFGNTKLYEKTYPIYPVPASTE